MSEIDKKKISLDIKKVVNQASDNFSSTVDSRYLEVKGTLWKTSRYPYFDRSDLQNRGKYQLNYQISHMNM